MEGIQGYERRKQTNCNYNYICICIITRSGLLNCFSTFSKWAQDAFLVLGLIAPPSFAPIALRPASAQASPTALHPASVPRSRVPVAWSFYARHCATLPRNDGAAQFWSVVLSDGGTFQGLAGKQRCVSNAPYTPLLSGKSDNENLVSLSTAGTPSLGS